MARAVVPRQVANPANPRAVEFELTKFGRRRKSRFSPRTKIVVGSAVGCAACGGAWLFFL